MSYIKLLFTVALMPLVSGFFALTAQAQTHVGDVEIWNSLCVGFDCPGAGPAYGDSTILMMENNTRIKFGDTSNSASFPRNDWEIEANASTNGGANYLGFNDCGTADNDGGCATDLVFAVEAGVRQHALYVESDGDIGIGTNNPAVDIDIKTGNTPTVRLQQDGSSGFTPQTWDLAGNEANFFIRDVTNGSQLPFRIEPGAPSNAIYVDSTDGNIGMGTTSPQGSLDINTGSVATNIYLTNNSGAWRLNHNVNTGRLNIAREGGNTPVKIDDAADENLLLVGTNGSNQVDITGNIVISGQCTEVNGACADYVFGPDHNRLSLPELRAFIVENSHLPNVPSEAEIKKNGVNMAHFSGRLLEKIEELTLYTLEQEDTIDALMRRLEALESKG